MEDHRPNPGRRTIAQMVVVFLLITAIGLVAGLVIHWFPFVGSTQAKRIDTLWDVLVIASAPIFAIVATVVIFSVAKFRMRPGEENLDGPPIHGNTRLEVIWTAVPALLLVSLCTYAYIVLHDIEKAPANGNEHQVDVVGQQFAWTFTYHEGGKTFNAGQLYIPAGQAIKFRVRSKDVIHDFWVPDFRVKIDAVPGITTSYRVTPRTQAVGEHPIVCAELCGLGHAFMRATAHVLTPAAYQQWVRKMTSGAAGGGTAGGGAAKVDAKQLFVAGNVQTSASACGACHTLAAAGTSGSVGPDLDTSLKGKDAAFIRESIVDPNKVVAHGYAPSIMPPNFGQTLSPAQIDALVDYLAKVTNG